MTRGDRDPLPTNRLWKTEVTMVREDIAMGDASPTI